ncbi:hypothetical protein [Amycolatopsis sp. 195334CR]|uniref:hypothetical protein n=1 Tax=Amycolatopsis sp. 195334CR TaxID=2814588 RepID=UPI001A8D5847|nr:hypothetical protein [Amycolatopsis sp. 195334CR]MBN6035942.1 hypothetical protein [Amycolatopsis sp. 195334CR]
MGQRDERALARLIRVNRGVGTVVMRLTREIDDAEFSAAELRQLAELLAGLAEEARERAERIEGVGR